MISLSGSVRRSAAEVQSARDGRPAMLCPFMGASAGRSGDDRDLALDLRPFLYICSIRHLPSATHPPGGAEKLELLQTQDPDSIIRTLFYLRPSRLDGLTEKRMRRTTLGREQKA